VIGWIVAGIALIGVAAGVVVIFKERLAKSTIESYEAANRSLRASVDALEIAEELKAEKLSHAEEVLSRQTREIQDLQRMVLQRAEVAEVAAALRDHDANAAQRHDAIMRLIREVRRRNSGE
jgi:hypothetical protein